MALGAIPRLGVLLRAGENARAQERLAELESQIFFDLAWIDRCPLLAPLRGTTELLALRRGTAARVTRALAAFGDEVPKGAGAGR